MHQINIDTVFLEGVLIHLTTNESPETKEDNIKFYFSNILHPQERYPMFGLLHTNVTPGLIKSVIEYCAYEFEHNTKATACDRIKNHMAEIILKYQPIYNNNKEELFSTLRKTNLFATLITDGGIHVKEDQI